MVFYIQCEEDIKPVVSVQLNGDAEFGVVAQTPNTTTSDYDRVVVHITGDPQPKIHGNNVIAEDNGVYLVSEEADHSYTIQSIGKHREDDDADVTATNFSTTVNLTPETVESLKKQDYSLYTFKAVQGTAAGAAPTIWFILEKQKLLTKTTIKWTEQYGAYNSTTQIEPNTIITSTNSVKTDLDKLVTINSSGNLSQSNNGIPGAVSFLNNAAQQFTVGISQVVNGENNVLCAFPILGSGSARVITPIFKIALIFSTATVETSTVITRAMSGGALIDLTGVSSRSVDFCLNKGWTAPGSPSWLNTFHAFSDMRSLLIESPSKEEKSIVKTYLTVNA